MIRTKIVSLLAPSDSVLLIPNTWIDTKGVNWSVDRNILERCLLISALIRHMRLLLLTWINFTPSMDKQSRTQ